MFIAQKNGGILGLYKVVNQPKVKYYSKERFWSRLSKRTSQSNVRLNCQQIKLAWQFRRVVNRSVRTEIVYGWLFTSVLDLFVVLNAIQLYELCTIKPKGGYYSHEVLNSTYQVLTKFHKVCTKSLFCFRKKGSEKHSVLVKRKLPKKTFNLLPEQNDSKRCGIQTDIYFEKKMPMSKWRIELTW